MPEQKIPPTAGGSIALIEPSWGSALASNIVELEKLRDKRLGGPVAPEVFFQLKEIFQSMESLGSARIEGNRTTLAEYVEQLIETQDKNVDHRRKEIENLNRVIDFVDENIGQGVPLTHGHLLEMHKIVVDGLLPPPSGEGSRTPGSYRNIPVGIKGADHEPPMGIAVRSLMDELLTFVNQTTEPKNDLLVTAISHHRFAWIHPFDNGNGRMARAFTYAMLVKQGFRVSTGRILNPTAIFCMDRDKYNSLLAGADGGDAEGVLAWCDYVLAGLRVEIEKIDRLLDREYLTKTVLTPALAYAKDRKQITDDEHRILQKVITQERMTIKAADLDTAVGMKLTPIKRSRLITKLRDKKMLQPLKDEGRIYTIWFINSYLLRGVMKSLEDAGFVPPSLNKN